MNRRKFIAATGIAMSSIAVTQQSKAASGPWHLINKIFSASETQIPKFKPLPATWSDSEFTASWIGHATVLINFFGTKIITDPILSDRAGINVLGLFTLGPKRIVAPALDIHEIGQIDLVLISHAHMDHLDKPSLSSLVDKKSMIVMAKHTKDVISNLDFTDVTELDWNEKIDKADVTIEALRVKHFGWRFPWEEDRSRGYRNGRSFNAFLVKKNGFSFVFGGDTALNPFFKKLGAKNEKINLAIMPIGTYNPWIHAHCNPEQAVSMSTDMNAKMILPIHWDTFIVSDEPVMEPIQRLKNALAQSDMQLALDAIGKTVVVHD